MSMTRSDSYHGWNIRVSCERDESSFCTFDVIDPTGHSHHVPMGGDNEQRALERAKEYIDLELALSGTH